ncbi:unnamed protein product [Cylicostephanus goldi]|uniref:Uncharacterized protein n=1 Tax=Cylicostephanus goldi TaxID=71465 RepID=A0A3P6QRZ6_CYLGO|nr:unnamed protein product [Cylicostephanus goldi]
MSRPPTVSELVGNSNITFRPVVPAHSEDTIRADYDTDSLWKPRRVQPQRTCSVESSDSEGLRRSSEAHIRTAPIDVPRPRRISLSEMIFGSPTTFSWGQTNIQSSLPEGRRASVTEDPRFHDLIKHQNKILGDGH